MVKDAASSSSRDSSIKKRRKTSVESDGEGDTYKKVVTFEEHEAFKRSPDADSKLFCEICKNIRSLLEEIHVIKSAKGADASMKTSEKTMQAAALVLTLKKLNRLEKVRSSAARESLTTEKQKVDSINLQYQNLLYEAAHLLSEYKKCKQFRSKDEDIQLISIEEFFKEAPEEKTKPFKDVKNLSDLQKHDLHLARLEWELIQRKKLAGLCNTFEEEKKQIAADIIKIKNRLAGLAPRLGVVLEATKPLQEYLGWALEKTYTDHKFAALLPNPLYLLYAYADAYRNVYEIDMTLNICGDQDEASQWKQNTEQLEYESDTENEQQEIEENVEVKKRHRRLTSQVNRHEEKKKHLFQTHPLSVQISIKIKDGPCLNMNFTYRTTLNIITVTATVNCPSNITGTIAREAVSGESILGELFVDDTGTESPNPSNVYQLQKIEVTAYHTVVPTLGYAYSWAQKVCGLDFLTPLTNKNMAELSCKNVEIVMKMLTNRLKSRIALAIQLQQLEQNTLPAIPETVELPRNAVSAITKWDTSTWQDFCKSPAAAGLIASELVASSDLFYSVVISRPKHATLNAFVCIKNDYPKQLPIISITVKYNGEFHSGNNDIIRDMERAVNTTSDSNIGANCLLAAQMYRLCAYFDIYLEISSPSNFEQNTTFFKSICGRNRRHPFKFRKVGSGVFTHF